MIVLSTILVGLIVIGFTSLNLIAVRAELRTAKNRRVM